MTSALAATVLDAFVRTGRNRAVVSAVSATELLVRPFRNGADDLVRTILEFLATFPNLEVAPVDLSVARRAALVRARTGLRAPDAIVIASGLDRSATVAVSDDAGWPAEVGDGAAAMRVVALRTLV